MLLTADRICKDYGGKKILENITFFLNPGDKLGLIGINGTGKSTLLKILAGEEYSDSGMVATDPNVRRAFLQQNPVMNPNNSIIDEVLSSFPDSVRDQYDYEARAMLTNLGINNTEQKICTLSGGQRKRVAIVKVLTIPSDILILDEPTNHLDHETTQWLEKRLQRYTGAIIMVTHDRYFLDRVTNKIAELTHGKMYISEANYSEYLLLKAERIEMAAASERKRQALLKKEYEWISRGCRARSTKSAERIQRYEDLKAQKPEETDRRITMAGISSRLGRKTIELQGVCKAFDGREVLKPFSYSVLRDDRIGIVGRNGAGKSTLLNIIAGRLQPDSGSVDVGSTVRIGYFSQEGMELDPKQRPYDYIHEIASSVHTSEGNLSATQLMERFLFTSELQFSTIAKLSGGERRRLFLLGILMSAPNILLLDEPTNDLDVETLTILEDYLDDYQGAVISVSHDRYFLDKTAEMILDMRDDGSINRSIGNYTDYLKIQTDSEPKKNQSAKEETVKKKPDNTPRKKFTFKEQRDYDHIEAEIEELEQKLSEIETRIEENAADYVRLQELSKEKDVINGQLDEKTERWLYLQELAESFERR